MLDNSLIVIGIVLLLIAVFILGAIARSGQLLYDRLATWRIRRAVYFQVGDLVTLANNLTGIVTMLTPVSTVLLTPTQTQLIISNSIVLRHPIQVHTVSLPPSMAAPMAAAMAVPVGLEDNLAAPGLASPAADAHVADTAPLHPVLPIDESPVSALANPEPLLPAAATAFDPLPVIDENNREQAQTNPTEQPLPAIMTSPAFVTYPPTLPNIARLTRRAKLGKQTIKQLKLH